MEVTRDGIVFKWEEIHDALPEGLQNGWRIRQILGDDARRTFDIGVDRISIQTTKDDIVIYVMPYGFAKPSSETPLSAAVSLCEEVIKKAKNAGVFNEFIVAMQVLDELDSYIRRRVSEEVNHALAEMRTRLQQLEAMVKQNQKK